MLKTLPLRRAFAPVPAGFLLATLVAVSALGACTAPRPYSLEIQQGIVVDQKMIARLSPGMTRNQVGLALGTPLLADPLHADRWDYVYYTRHRGAVGEWRRFSCLFKNDLLASVSGDVTVGAETKATAPLPDAPGASSGLPAPLPGPGPGPAAPAAPVPSLPSGDASGPVKR